MSRWKNFGEQCIAVVRAVRDRNIHPFLAAAPSTATQEATGGDGGYAVAPDYRTEVASRVFGDGSLIALTDLQRATSNSITIPADKTAPWSTSGPQVTLQGEASALGQSKLKAEASALKLSRASIFLPVTDEMMEDAVGLSAYLTRVVAARFSHKLNDWIVNGDGVGKPLGLMNAGAKLMQTKEGAQAAATINLANTQKMFTRLPTASYPTACWLAHPETQPQLSALGLPHYSNEEGGPTLHGLPVRYVEVAAPLGTEGDLILADLKSYLAVVRAYPNAANDIKTDVSMHVFFDVDMAALRFSMRVAGAPWVAAPWTRYRTSTTISHFVTLEAR